ncbi:MAG: DsrE family protein [Pseudomonadota bacterium]
MSTVANGNNRFLFIVTGFDEEPDRTAAPLVLANNALAAGGDVLVWVTHEGTKLAKNGEAGAVTPTSFPNLGELINHYIEAGGRIGICPPCAKTHGVTEDNMVSNAGWMGAQALLAEMAGRQVLSF